MDKVHKNSYMKYLVSAGILVLLIGFPLLSWYYLQTGLDYRKELEGELVTKGSLADFGIKDDSLFKGKTTLWQLKDVSDKESLVKLYDQFDQSPTFQLLSNDDVQGKTVIPFDLSLIRNESLKAGTFALIDSSLQVRNIYPDFSKETIKNIVAHTAITLPLTKKRKIKTYDEKGRR